MFHLLKNELVPVLIVTKPHFDTTLVQWVVLKEL